MKKLIFRRVKGESPFIRNRRIIDNCDELHAFWDGKSTGTRNAIHLAKLKKIPIYVYLATGKESPMVEVIAP